MKWKKTFQRTVSIMGTAIALTTTISRTALAAEAGELSTEAASGSNIGFWIGLGGVLAGGGLAAVIVLLKCRKEEESE
jgi:hypothetical protein